MTTTTPRLGLIKPQVGGDFDLWGDMWNANADKLDTFMGGATPGPFLPLAGGSLNAGAPLNLAMTTPASANATPTFQNVWTFTGTGGVASTVDVQALNYVGINTAVGQSIWANRDTINYNSPTPSLTGASYISRVMLAHSYADRGSDPTKNPIMWAAISNAIDGTNHASSIGGRLLTHEFDIEAAGLDDAPNSSGLSGGRQIIVAVAMTHNYPTNPTSEFKAAYSVYAADNGVKFKNLFTFAAPFNNAGIDFTSSTSIGGAPAIMLNTGQSIAFDSVKNMQLRWSTANTALELQWLGSRVWSVDPGGSMIVAGAMTCANVASFTGGLKFSGGDNSAGSIYTDGNYGCLIRGKTTAIADVALESGAGNIKFTLADFGIGFNGTNPIAKPVITGSIGTQTVAVLAEIIDALANYGLVTKSTTP